MAAARTGRLAYSGHSIVRASIGGWRCSCGEALSGGPLGAGRDGARDVMRFHVASLEAKAVGWGVFRYGGWLVNTETGEIVGRRGQPLKGSLSEDGYRYIQGGKERRKLFWHRLVWCVANGPVPDGMEINHINGIKIDNRLSNLECVTRSENALHAFALGLRDNHGENHPGHKLTEHAVIEIRRRYADGCPALELAKEFGVTRRSISDVVTRKTWGHVTGKAA